MIHPSLQSFSYTARCMLIVYGIGLLGHYVISPSEKLGDWESLAMAFGMSPEGSTVLQEKAIWCIVFCAFLAGLLPTNGRLWLRAIATFASMIAFWRLSSSGIASVGSHKFDWMSLGEHATRIALPALVSWVAWETSRGTNSYNPDSLAKRCLQFGSGAAALTFIVHGLKAISQNPAFSDLITDSARRVISLGIDDSLACKMLLCIGIVDLVAAIAVFTRFRRAALRYMFIWGFISAWSRVTAIPFPESWDEPMIRVANGGVPLLMLLILRDSSVNTATNDEIADPAFCES